ncbi:hypothetical protein [Paenibacillus koleovorans]|uniref:hypothetical protein n=1 Tax=Paenibacillus koleovorans TaxID=121608 RepID=UPI000FD909BA|nr:hypothetical protein [Paenibacillus koleovorans]
MAHLITLRKEVRVAMNLLDREYVTIQIEGDVLKIRKAESGKQLTVSGQVALSNELAKAFNVQPHEVFRVIHYSREEAVVALVDKMSGDVTRKGSEPYVEKSLPAVKDKKLSAQAGTTVLDPFGEISSEKSISGKYSSDELAAFLERTAKLIRKGKQVDYLFRMSLRTYTQEQNRSNDRIYKAILEDQEGKQHKIELPVPGDLEKASTHFKTAYPEYNVIFLHEVRKNGKSDSSS